MAVEPLSRLMIYKIVNNYIGVVGGYLGSFSYRTHQEFYPLYCDLDINPVDYEGTTKDRFTTILACSKPRVQAKILRGLLEKFPLDEPDAPKTRTTDLRDQIFAVARELERTSAVDAPPPLYSVAVVDHAIADAEVLIKANGATSAIDRVHTALHGFLLRVCQDAKLLVQGDPTLPALFRTLRDQHPAFQATGPRAEDITKIIKASGVILDCMNPLRNQASMAHPNERLLANEEATLVINVARSILHYLDTKLPAYSTE